MTTVQSRQQALPALLFSPGRTNSHLQRESIQNPRLSRFSVAKWLRILGNFGFGGTLKTRCPLTLVRISTNRLTMSSSTSPEKQSDTTEVPAKTADAVAASPEAATNNAVKPSCRRERANVCSCRMEREYELESLRRSLAMLRPGAPALDREEAMRLVRELQDLEGQLRRLRQGLQELLAEGG